MPDSIEPFRCGAQRIGCVNNVAAHLYERLLVLRCQAGDEAALAELIARYSPRLRLFLCKLMATDTSAADDLLQETWFDAYRKINRLRRPDSFAAWIYRLARDRAYRAMRRRRLPSAPLDLDVPNSIDVDADRFSNEEAAAVREALDELPLEQREVLILRFVEEISYEQIADVIGRPVGTVRSRIHYGKRALRAALTNRAQNGNVRLS